LGYSKKGTRGVNGGGGEVAKMAILEKPRLSSASKGMPRIQRNTGLWTGEGGFRGEPTKFLTARKNTVGGNLKHKGKKA